MYPKHKHNMSEILKVVENYKHLFKEEKKLKVDELTARIRNEINDIDSGDAFISLAIELYDLIYHDLKKAVENTFLVDKSLVEELKKLGGPGK